MGIFNTETYETLLCSGSVIGRHDNMPTHDGQVSLSTITIVNIRLNICVSVSFEITWFNLEPDMISPEVL